MEIIKITKKELLESKKKLKLSYKALKILKLKKDSLLIELYKILRELKIKKLDINKYLINGKEYVLLSKKYNGIENIYNDIIITKEIDGNIKIKNIMGIKIPEILIEKIEDHTFSSIYNFLIFKNYKELFLYIMEYYTKQIEAIKIIKEIHKLNRKINSLENNIIPKLIKKINYIKIRLDDLEREDKFRYKFIKDIKENA